MSAAEEQTVDTNLELSPERLRAWIPGLASLAMHLAVVVCATLFFRPPTRGFGEENEAPRDAAVAVVRRSPQAVEYLTDSAPSKLTTASGQASAAPESVAPAPPQPAALPGLSLPEPGSTPAVELPGSGLPTVAGSGRPGATFPGLDEQALAEMAGRSAAAAPAGPSATLALFNSSGAKGNSFVLVVDRSASMGNEGLGAIDAAVQELRRRLVALSEEHKIQVIAYNSELQSFGTGRLLPATSETKEGLLKFLTNIGAFGPTNHSRALLAALKLQPDVIILLTDGDEPGLDLTQQRIIRGQAGRRTSIHCLHFGRGPATEAGKGDFLRRLALDNGGAYQYVELR